MSEFTDEAKQRMGKTIDSLKHNFAKIRTGRANAHVLDDIRVEYYGVQTPIVQLAGIKVPEASLLVIEPWDKTALRSIERAIMDSDLGIMPSNDGICIRLPFPKPTEERRRELAKECKGLAEEARVAIRNVRREANAKIERDEALTEDDVKREQKKVQKLTDDYIKEVDKLIEAKEKELFEI